MPAHIDRRKQPQITLRAIGEALAEIDWKVHEVTNLRFISPKGKWVNESFGYRLKIPREMPFIRKLWLGYLSHKDIRPAGIYAGMTPLPTGPGAPSPHEIGYRFTPEGFDAWILIKQIIPQAEIEEMEKKYGQTELKKKIKGILMKTYPFSLK